MVRLAGIWILNDIFLEKIDVKLENNKIPSAVKDILPLELSNQINLKAIIADDHRFKPDNFYKTKVDDNGVVRFGFIKALLTRTTAN